MINFIENLIKVEGSTSDGILPGREKIKIRLVLKDGIEGLILTLINIFYLPNSPSNLVNIGLLNNAKIYHNNKDKTLYNIETQKILTFTK